jgi:hypothetical protein
VRIEFEVEGNLIFQILLKNKSMTLFFIVCLVAKAHDENVE